MANRRVPPLIWIAAFSAILLFLVLSIAFSFTRGPWWDEGVLADVAVNFGNSGYLRNSVLAPHSHLDLPAINQYMYWQFPLYLVSLGAWFRITAATVECMRLFSVVWGCVYIVCWFLFVRGMSRNTTVALIVASVVALDYSCVGAASNGRMEMMCAALGQAALAAYVCLRNSHETLAFLLAGVFGAASFFCHPMGALTSLFLALVMLYDWRRLKWRVILLSVIPYCLGAILYGMYVAQAPQIFRAQAKAEGFRVATVSSLFANVGNDLYQRYFSFYFANIFSIAFLRAFALLFGVAGLIALIATRRLRSDPLARVLVLLAITGYIRRGGNRQSEISAVHDLFDSHSVSLWRAVGL